MSTGRVMAPGRDRSPLRHRSPASAARRAVIGGVTPPPTCPPSADQGAQQQEPRDDVLGPDELGRFSAEDKAQGRHAGRPSEIPPRGWWAVLRRVVREAISDEVGMAAASCGFYAMLALFPAISVSISLYGLVADPGAIENQLAGLRDVLPASTYQMIAGRVHDLATAGPTKLSWGLAVSLPVALWSAMNGTKAIIRCAKCRLRGAGAAQLASLQPGSAPVHPGRHLRRGAGADGNRGRACSLVLYLARSAGLDRGPGLLVRAVAGLGRSRGGAALPLRAIPCERQMALDHAGLAGGSGAVAGGLAGILVLMSAISVPTTRPTAPLAAWWWRCCGSGSRPMPSFSAPS